MAEDAHKIIKNVDPNAIIITPTVTGNYETQQECVTTPQYCGTTWLNSWLASGGSNYVDVIGVHGYTDSGLTPERIQGAMYQVQAAMNQNGVGTLPLWDTESSWGENKTLPAQADQASWLARHILLEESIGVQRTFWYAYDTNTWGGLWTSTAGLNTAGDAYQQVAKWLIGTTLSKPCAISTTDLTTFTCVIYSGGWLYR